MIRIIVIIQYPEIIAKCRSQNEEQKSRKQTTVGRQPHHIVCSIVIRSIMILSTKQHEHTTTHTHKRPTKKSSINECGHNVNDSTAMLMGMPKKRRLHAGHDAAYRCECIRLCTARKKGRFTEDGRLQQQIIV